MLNIYIIIILITAIVSYFAFQKYEIMSKLQLNAWSVFHRKEWWRLLTCGFVHADWMHLIINMLVLYSFGGSILYYFQIVFGGGYQIIFATLYLTAIPISSIYSVYKYKNRIEYNAVGASGAISAVIFTSIFFSPYSLLYFFGIIPIPAIVFGICYLAYSAYMAKRNMDNIGHDAHFFGAVYGFLFPIALKPSLIGHFINEIFSIF